MKNRIERMFAGLRRRKKKAFIAFLTAGFPDLPATARLVSAFEKAGVDLIELGIPFSDPVADGPVIQQASFEALRKGATLGKTLAMVRKLRSAGLKLPVCFMSYYNPVLAYGLQRFVRDAAACGVDGLIIPDMPFEESAALRRLAAGAGLKLILFIAPTTQPRRQAAICRRASGFIYYVCLTGVTGQAGRLPADAGRHVKAIKRLTRVPVCVGFGIATPEQVRQVQASADGVIVGSAIIRKIRECKGSAGLVEKVTSWVTALKG